MTHAMLARGVIRTSGDYSPNMETVGAAPVAARAAWPAVPGRHAGLTLRMLRATIQPDSIMTGRDLARGHHRVIPRAMARPAIPSYRGRPGGR